MVTMVDVLVSGVITQLGTIIQNEIKPEVRLVVGVKKDVEKLSRTLMKILAVLKDAEERQIKENSVRLWLQELQDIVYDIDDVLDEWRTEILRSQIGCLTKKVRPGNLFSPAACYFSFKQIGLHHDIAHKIKDIKERLDEIASDKDKFGFIETTTIRNELIIDDESRRRLETSSLLDVSEVFGRDMDKDTIISKLISEGSSQQDEMVSDPVPPMIISIVGMPGLGKTTLAQLIFNDERVRNHFNKRIWVHVSKPFDKEKVAMRIIEEIGGGENNIVSQGGGHHIAWDVVHRQLATSIQGAHFLLILDDVWNEDRSLWDPLWISLRCGSQRSRIILTTRNERVGIMMGTTVHKLGVLSDENCWSLLRHYAFDGRQDKECEKLKELGMELSKRCEGLPLSAKTLGSLLRFKDSIQGWQYVLQNDIWKVVSTLDKPVLPALLLSYNDFPSHLKQCFAYCSFFPKGYPINKYAIIKQWMAQGFLGDHLVDNCDDLIALGEEYFNNLVIRSFFQKDVTRRRGAIEFFRMHDLIYDFAKSLVENECFSLTIKDTNAQEFDFNRARHLYLLIKGINTIPSFLYKAKNLRTLTIFGGRNLKISSKLFSHLTCLRTLDLSGTYVEKLPNEIEKLIHLRFLDLSEARFKELPKTVTKLYNLQILRLYGCKNLCKLPEGIGGLVNLTELDLKECHQVSYFPEGIGRLSKLRGLSFFVIGGVERGGCKIGELQDLNFLQGDLMIIGLGRVKNRNEAKMAYLMNKPRLRALYFYFNQYTGVSWVDENGYDYEGEKIEEEEKEEEAGVSRIHENVVDEEEEVVVEEEVKKEEVVLSRRMEDVLENLQPHQNLEKLIICDYPGSVLPSWMCDHENFMIFSNLVFLELSHCSNCKQVPPTLGKLPSLETLVIHQMDKVKFMGMDFFGIDCATSDGGVDAIFPKLKVFQLSWMNNLKEWDLRLVQNFQEGKEFIFMPCLQYLFLYNLPKLSSFPQHLTQATSLRKLFIWNCPKLNWMPSSPSSHLPFLHIEELILKMDAGSFSKSLVPNNNMFVPNLKLLRVRQSPFSSLPEGLGKLTSLQILDIRTCSKIKSIPEGELQHLTTLQELRIMRCPALRRSCQKEIGEDWSKISHIPNIFIDGKKIK